MNELSDNEWLSADESEKSFSRYSDEVNSDIENELYSSIYFFNESDDSHMPMHTKCSNVNSFPSQDVNLLHSNLSDVNDKRLNMLMKTFPSKRNPNVVTYSQELSVKKMLIKTEEDACAKKFESEDETSTSSSLYFEDLPSKTDIVTNMTEAFINSPDESMSNMAYGETVKVKNSLNKSSSNASIELNTGINKYSFSSNFAPVIVASESSSSSFDEIFSKSLPSKFEKLKCLKMNRKNVWQVDLEDRVCSKKILRFFNSKKCGTCGEDGHGVRSCPKGKSKKCYICGDNHLSKYCNKRICSFCYNFGHPYQKCPRRNSNNQVYCDLCRLSGHTSNLCPDLWRRFHATTSHKNIIQSPGSNGDFSSNFCYNCGFQGHLGHECYQPKSRYSSSSPWPFVISYESPDRFMHSRSCEYPNNRSAKTRTTLKEQRRKRKLDKFTSTPINSTDSQYFQTKNVFRKKKLFFDEQDFQRTPNDHIGVVEDSKRKRKSRGRKKKRNLQNKFASKVYHNTSLY